jgi:PKD repeat protein
MDHSQPSGRITSWSWNFGDGTASSSQHPTHPYQQAGTYNVCLTIFTRVDSFTIDSCTYCSNVYVANVTACKASLYLYKDSISTSQTWHAIPQVAGKAPFSYLWNFGDGETSTLQYPVHSYSVAGHYKICLTVTDATGCVSSSCDSTYRKSSVGIIDKLVVVPAATVGVTEHRVLNSYVYPNPANEVIHISFSKEVNGIISLVDITGRAVLKQVVNSTNQTLNISDIPSGLYSLQVVAGNEIDRSKVVIRK